MNSMLPFLKVAAVCSILGAVTTATLMYLPQPELSDINLSFQDSTHMFKKWVLFLHPQFNIMASFGLAFLLAKKHAVYAIIGTFFLTVWAYTEMTQQAFLIDAVNQMWKSELFQSTDPALSSQLDVLIKGSAGISDSYYFLLLYGFGFGTLLFGIGFLSFDRDFKILAYGLIYIGILSLCAFMYYYLGLSFLKGFISFSYSYIYGILQPLVRLYIAYLIFKWIQKESQIN